MARLLGVAALAAVILASAVQGYTEPPPTTALPGTVEDCTWWAVAEAGDTCRSLADGNFISQTELKRMNPSLAADGCPVIVDNSYCVEENYGSPPATTPGGPPTTTTTARPTTTAGNGVTTPLPTQSGMVPNCARFFLVKEGDGFCDDIAKSAGITPSDFYKYNAGVGDRCQNLWLDTYYCVGLIGMATAPAQPPATTTTTTTSPGNGVVTPTPTQTGMVSNCAKFVLVREGDGFCDDIAKTAGISTADFYRYNAGVGTGCKNLWLDTYYCVGLIGAAPPPPASTTTQGNGIATPTPIQGGMASNCRRFHFVVGGDTCATVAKKYSITEANFYEWNREVNDGGICKSLWLDTYYCVGL